MSRLFATLFIAAMLLYGVVAQGQSDAPHKKRMIVLGVDGLDPEFVQHYAKEGLLPNMSRLIESGGFSNLGTSIPPQSPVAWSNFITGLDPGGHGIFDFIAIDRATMLPYLSTSRVEAGAWGPISFGEWRIPLSAERTMLLRDGDAFWQLLEERGVSTRMFRIPANYPPVESEGVAVSGMGTPDLLGTSGTFTFFTDDPAVEPGTVSGGTIKRAAMSGGRMIGALTGPANAFRENAPETTAKLVAQADQSHPVAMIEIGEERVLLNVGEWSEWVRVEFEQLSGLVSTPGMVRLYLKAVRPHFELYVSPVNIDPRDPAQPISTPAAYASDLAEAAGPFYTQEMPEDTKALSAGVLDARQFLAQSGLVLDERRRLLRHELDGFKAESEGLMFFYLSSVDQRNHMMYRYIDRKHPFHATDTPEDLLASMQTTYQEIDEIVGWLLAELDERTTLIVMSDHGFAPFNRQVHLNAWLEQNGYLKLKNPKRRDESEWLQGINWSRTRAFAVGLNSLYINVRGRDRYGIVPPAERAAVAQEIADKLSAWIDPDTGERVITQIPLREEVYNGPHVAEAPDILVGYGRGYRASWSTTTGKVPALLVEDNLKEWSGDHCMDSRTVPGVLMSNRPLSAEAGDLKDLTVTILTHFGVDAPAAMKGRSLLQ